MTNNLLGNILTIDSPKNNFIKNIYKLTKKKYRLLHQLFISEGENFLVQAIKKNWEIKYIIINKDLKLQSKTINLINEYPKNNLKIVNVSKDILIKLSSRANFESIIFVTKQKKFNLFELTKSNVCVALDNIHDPGTLGSIIRTLDAFCINSCILIGCSVDPFSPEVVRSSMGSIYNSKIVKCYPNDFIKWVSQNSINLYGTDVNSTVNYEKEDWKLPMCLLLGNERLGLSKNLSNRCKENVKIITRKNFNSLNVSVAAGIIMSDIIRKNPNILK